MCALSYVAIHSSFGDTCRAIRQHLLESSRSYGVDQGGLTRTYLSAGILAGVPPPA